MLDLDFSTFVGGGSTLTSTTQVSNPGFAARASPERG